MRRNLLTLPCVHRSAVCCIASCTCTAVTAGFVHVSIVAVLFLGLVPAQTILSGTVEYFNINMETVIVFP